MPGFKSCENTELVEKRKEMCVKNLINSAQIEFNQYDRDFQKSTSVKV